MSTNKPQSRPPAEKGAYKLWCIFLNHTVQGDKPLQQHYHKLPRLFTQVNQKWKGKVQVARVYYHGDLIYTYNLEDGWQQANVAAAAGAAQPSR